MVQPQFVVYWDWRETSTFGLVWAPAVERLATQIEGPRLVAAGTKAYCEAVLPLFAASDATSDIDREYRVLLQAARDEQRARQVGQDLADR